jgi:hypothetical protein
MRAARYGVVGVAAAALLAAAGVGLAASSYSDPPGDANEAPDIVDVKVSQSTDGNVNVAVAVDNFAVLPVNSWINLWFDLDSNASTGDGGDEALVRYSSDGRLEFFLWNGTVLARQPETAMSASYADGVLTFSTPGSVISSPPSFGILAVASRGQDLGDGELIASDFAPDRGRSAWVGPNELDFPDPGHDNDAAPDITSINVSDAKNGWLSFAISTPNYEQLPAEALIVLLIDQDNRSSTGEEGLELALTIADGELEFERWDPVAKRWRSDQVPTRARVRNAGNVLTIDVHVSELENTPILAFGVLAADVNLQAEAVLGLDLAPDGDRFYQYRLANKPALLLTATSVTSAPARPRAGRPFTVNLGVRRSDTQRPIGSGAVSCRVLVSGKPVPAKGTVSGGAAHCRMLVPAGSAGKALRGTITVRVGGKAVVERFSFVVR